MQIPEHASNWANQHGWQIVIINVTTNYCKWNVNNSSILGLVGRGISWRRVGPLLLRISWIDLTLRTNCSARLIIHLYRQWGMIPGTAPAVIHWLYFCVACLSNICDLWFCYDNTSIKTTCKVKDKLHLHFDKVADFITVEALYPRTNRQLNLEAFVIVHIFL